MDQPHHEATGSRRSPDKPLPLSPTQRVRVKIDCVQDCLRRALDNLDADDYTTATWPYVAGQLRAAGLFAGQAEAIAAVEAEKTEAAADPINNKVPTVEPDPFIPVNGKPEEIGGES